MWLPFGWFFKCNNNYYFLISYYYTLIIFKNSSNASSLLKSVPNPFSNSTTISFTISQPQKVSLKIYDMTGRLVKTLADTKFEKGQHELKWNAQGVTAGIYILQYNAGNYSETRKLSVIK